MVGVATSEAGARLQSIMSAAIAARQQGHADEERRLLGLALELAPNNPHVLNARGMRALADHDHERARACFASAAEADPKEETLWINLATANRALGDDDGERSALDRVLDLNRLHFVAQLRMAELNQRVGRMAEAAQHWSNVVQMATGFDQRPPAVEDALARGRAFLAAHNETLARKLDDVLGDTLQTRDPKVRRFSACVDHVLGRRAIYQNHCAGVHFPFLPADEFFERESFPWLAELEAKTPAIREEALALLARGGDAIRPYVRQDAGTPENKWTALDQSLDWSACFLWEYGVRNDQVCALCPETAAALERVPRSLIPGKAPSAFFSILKPRTHIPAHTGVSNIRAIVHLPLVVPDGCRFRVGGEVREWKVGEAFAFDDTIEHEAWNDSDEIRIVLIFDVWNPHLTTLEQDLLKQMFATIGDNTRF